MGKTAWDDRNHIAESNAFTPDLAADAGYGEGQVQGSRGRVRGGHGRVPALVPGQGGSRPSLRVCNRFLVLLVGKRSPRFGDKGIVPRVGEERSRGKADSMTSGRPKRQSLAYGEGAEGRACALGNCVRDAGTGKGETVGY